MNRTGHALHGGNLRSLTEGSGWPADDILDASANLNPLGPPDWLDAVFMQARRVLGAYPDPEYRQLCSVAARSLGVEASSLVFGNGADELMFALARCLAARSGSAAAKHYLVEPAYASYREAAESAGFGVVGISATDAGSCLATAPAGSAIWLGAPNNPDGTFVNQHTGVKAGPGEPATLWLAWLEDKASGHPELYFIVDESFVDFVDNADPAGCLPLCQRLPNIIVLRSMTKFWSVPGLRLGYLVWPAGAASVRQQLPNWPLNSVAERFALYAFGPDAQVAERRKATLDLLRTERAAIRQRLATMPGIRADFGLANFYLLSVAPSLPPVDLAAGLLRLGVAVRRCDNFSGLDSNTVRVALRTPEENCRLLDALESVLTMASNAAPSPEMSAEGGRAKADTEESSSEDLGAAGKTPEAASNQTSGKTAGKRPAQARALMIQGCSSSAGKSLLTAAFCRIFRNKGYDVAPYKAQNMSLNSAVTPDGLEIGRAQAVQAAACGLDADVRMNPVLLKPESERGSQLVLMGKPAARYQAQQYYEQHHTMRQAARAAYDSLASDHELIVLEGAGSPAEINLKPRDFVNMGAALHARASVLLVGDIDRGGVFASFIGTVSTFTPAELKLFKGFLVNKFRGDPALLGSAFEMTRQRSGYPVLGCIPMLHGLNIPDEDEPVLKAGQDPAAPLRLAVPKLRHVSNFTDLDAFAADGDVAIFPLASGADLAALKPDAVILPGSKSTMADLQWLETSGLAAAIQKFAAAGGVVCGLCGGYQMMGQLIVDSQHVESDRTAAEGLGILPVRTDFSADKTLVPGQASWLEGDISLNGYEIHQGQTRPLEIPESELQAGADCRPAVRTGDGRIIGYRSGQCWGSYLHGMFDSDAFRADFLNKLRQKKGLATRSATKAATLDAELDRLADAVATTVDMPYIESLIRGAKC